MKKLIKIFVISVLSALVVFSGEKDKNTPLNLLVCHREQDLSRLYTAGEDAQDLPESHVAALAKNRNMAVRYLLPNLIQTVQWPEKNQEIVLIGTKVVVPDEYRSPNREVKQHLEANEVILGSEIAGKSAIKEGGSVTFRGHQFRVEEIHAERGTVDDRTVWMSLPDAQKLLNKKGLISLIQVLECNCAWADVEQVEAELRKTLPDIRVMLFEETEK